MSRTASSCKLMSVEETVEEFRNGRMVILADDEERENEGDLVIPAQMATPEAINFMARYGRGLICLALSDERVRDLGLELMPKRNESRHDTAFTVSIEAREGITTGISASDRARTIAVAIDPRCGPDDLTSPGHVFPLVARDGGVLVRTGHTEASVDLARLAGLNPAAVICEIMNDDGTMARMPDLEAFSQRHNVKIATIADLIAYRLRHDSIIRRVRETTLTSHHGGTFRMYVYADTVQKAEHIALVKGDVWGQRAGARARPRLQYPRRRACRYREREHRQAPGRAQDDRRARPRRRGGDPRALPRAAIRAGGPRRGARG